MEGELKDKDTWQSGAGPDKPAAVLAEGSAGSRASDAFSHRLFLHSVHVSFYFYTWIVASMGKEEGQIENLVLFN